MNSDPAPFITLIRAAEMTGRTPAEIEALAEAGHVDSVEVHNFLMVSRESLVGLAV